MIRCVRIWTGSDNNSRFEDGLIDLPDSERGDLLGGKVPANSISFRETPPGGDFTPHNAPTRQLVITLDGTLEFKTATGASFRISPGDLLLAEDTHGTGHGWRLLDDRPWRRAYVILDDDTAVPFRAGAN